jgi:D-alanine-D-alanine ligase
MSKVKNLSVLLLFDGTNHSEPEKYEELWENPNWATEANVRKALLSLGHQVFPFGIHDEIELLVTTLRQGSFDLVFNLCEAFRNERRFEPNIVSLLEMMGVRHTGSGGSGLRLCKDKGLTKELLAYHRIRTPKFLVAKRSRPLRSLRRFDFPAFIKPLQLESSEGISQYSFAATEKEALSRMRYVHERLGVDAIIEEYIEGRELYVSVIGNEKLSVLPIRELFFREVPDGEPKFATFRAKWDEAYRKRWGIASGYAANLDPGLEARIADICKRIYRHLQIRGYGRIDLRVKENGEIYFIEANPNPSIAAGEDFALSAEKAGISYDELIAKIVSLSG